MLKEALSLYGYNFNACNSHKLFDAKFNQLRIVYTEPSEDTKVE